MSAAPMPRVECNGTPATVDDLRHLALTNYGHFSSMRVEDGAVRGLDLHLDRIERATRELFGSDLDRERVRAWMRHALTDAPAIANLRANVFSRALNRDALDRACAPDVLIIVSALVDRPDRALRLKSFRYTREAPHLKHVGTFALFHYRRLAQQAGFDDAVFVDADGCIAEGSIWNIGFREGDGVAWPDAPLLTGVSMQLLQAGLERDGRVNVTRRIALADIGRHRSAFFTNTSTSVRAIASIDATPFEVDPDFIAMLRACHDANPPQRI
jgi:branched-subunit amino acid aminotransferase/4-amino-4-deoxychorismate lyase